MSYIQSLKSMIQRSELLNAALTPAFISFVHPRMVRRQAKKRGLTVDFSGSSVDISDGRRIVRLARRHSIYANDVVNDFDFYHGAVAPDVTDGVEVVDYSVPKPHEILGFSLHPIFFNALAEPLATADQYLHFAQLSEGCTCIDLGAYSGLTSIIFREQCGETGRVVAVDADPANIRAIKTNFELYAGKTGRRVELLEGAVWSHDDGIHFSAEGNLGSSATDYVGDRLGAATRVASFKLSTIADRYGLQRVDFIKCDVEGAESVIFGDGQFFARFRPRIIIEVHRVDGTLTTQRVESDLAQHGYKFELVDQLGSTLPLLRCTPA